MAADPSPQMQKTKKLVRVRKKVEVVLPVEVLPPLPPSLAIICKHKVHEWITPEDYTFRLLDLNLVLTLAAVGCAGLGYFLFPWNRALGMALAAAFYVDFFAHAKASMLLHWDVFPRFVLAILDRGRRLMAVACVAIVVVCVLRFGTQDGVRRATLFIWTVAMALAALTGWVLRVDRRVSAAAEFVELDDDTSLWIIRKDGSLAAVADIEGDTTFYLLTYRGIIPTGYDVVVHTAKPCVTCDEGIDDFLTCRKNGGTITEDEGIDGFDV
uniref:Uncharacterized protein n=1 Tax=Oryza rufipogon TaxID=4529 RepID=A0A0E0N6E5_ORYRU